MAFYLMLTILTAPAERRAKVEGLCRLPPSPPLPPASHKRRTMSAGLWVGGGWEVRLLVVGEPERGLKGKQRARAGPD
jgi:hypothetical protein